MSDEQRQFLMTKRQCLIMELGALEDLLGMDRSIVPKRKRKLNETEQGWLKEMTIADIKHTLEELDLTG